jgi:PAS domain S-box-containing protein
LLVFDPAISFALEVLGWALLAGIAIYFLAFALEYTGRGELVQTPWYRGALTLPAVAVALLGTNSVHGLVWTDFTVTSVAGVAGAAYDLETWALLAATGGVVIAALGSLVLFDTVLSYGPLYRREAIAVGVSTVPPLSALIVWLYGIGPVPSLNFATVLFLPHIALDAYAFVGSDMFEFHPATRREGERAAIEDLANPVVIVDEQDRIVTLNAAAESVLGVQKETALSRPLVEFLAEAAIDVTDENQRVRIQTDGRRRIYSLATTPLVDGGDRLGSTVVLQDITDEIRREQRLQVLNRVVRHNLRNDMTVVQGFAEAANDEVEDSEITGMLNTIERKALELVDLGEKARDIERVLATERRERATDLRSLLADVIDDLDADVPIALDCPDVRVTTHTETLSVLCRALVENAVEHGSTNPRSHARQDLDAATADGDAPVRISVGATDERIEIYVADDGPGIPEHELAVLEAGEETDLEHSTGLGLWLANWATRRLGGDLTFQTDDGTTATLTLPVGPGE